MINVIITGKNGFLANALKSHLEKFGNYNIKQITLRDENWKLTNFKGIDVVIHTSALLNSNERKTTYEEFKRVNVSLTREIAAKCKIEEVPFFVFMSSMLVMLNKLPQIHRETVLNKFTICNPISKYAKSKFEAEKLLFEMSDDNFNVAIVRSPVIYGKNCKGNYSLLKRLALKLKIFPNIDNKKSMIYIENLCELIRLIIENKKTGVFMPQNRELVSVKNLVAEIAKVNGCKIYFSNILALPIKLMGNIIEKFAKAFGSVYYDENESNYFEGNYQIVDFKESIQKSEKSD